MSGAVGAFLIDQATRRYEGDLRTWVSRIRQARSAVEAARLFGQQPNPSGPMAPMMRSLVSGEKTRAASEAERLLEAAVEKEAGALTAAELDTIARCVGGHAPRVSRVIQNRRAVMRREATGER